MLQNIALICHKKEYAKMVAAELAERLEMQWFDVFDMLKFENKPRTFSEILKLLGTKSVKKQEEDIISYAADFSNSILVCESSMVESEKVWQKLKSNCLVVYLHCLPQRVLMHQKNQSYESEQEKKFFVLAPQKLEQRIEISKKNADIVVNCTRKSAFVSASHVIRSIQEYYQKKEQ